MEHSLADNWSLNASNYHLFCRSKMRRYLTKIFFPVCSRRYGNVLIIDYIICKLLYLLNVLVQLFALDVWLGANYHQYGIEVMVNLIKKLPWSNGRRFPQVTLCDFSTRDLGRSLKDFSIVKHFLFRQLKLGKNFVFECFNFFSFF